jgi:hypothetical protein
VVVVRMTVRARGSGNVVADDRDAT